ncbi:polysaccharide biosynthesis/export family protein [Occallatibacter savannae]|uniref:polysaccharide biosynthesis/export family protein n=1 Tax=Occallatibacter savannae TaxID=1002691 RepID=UPI000D689A2D|nr:polysaccharide biosynthesis/export family protein [Occallatibacter savannae]
MKLNVLHALFLGAALLGAGIFRGESQEAAGQSGASAPTAQSMGASDKAHDEKYVIGNDDVLGISVWKEPDLTKSIPVRSDGKISLPLVGELQATGKTPLQLENDITEKLKSFITAPEVNVIVQQVNSRKFNVMGEVSKPGSYPLTASTTIMDAIAIAGGFRDFAKKTGVYILRKGPDGKESRINFNYKSFIKGKNSDQNVRIEPNDTIIIP